MRGWARTGIVAALVLGAALLGCRRRYDPVRDARRIARYERSLIRHAARDSGCAPVQVQPVRIGETLWSANTCTGPREYFLYCRSRGRRWAHCRWRRVTTVNEAAAPVLSCPPPSIAQRLGANPTARFASGCGRTVQVALRCNEVGCGWVPAGPVQGAAARPGPPPPGPPAAATGGSPDIVVVPAPPQ